MKIDPNSLIFSIFDESSDVSTFSCSENKDLEDFLKNDAINYHREKVAITYLVHLDGELVGFFSSAVGCVRAEHVTKDMGEINHPPNNYPAHVIARMATQDGYRKKGIGREMLKHFFALTFNLCPYTGCRFIKVDAKNNEETINFYEKYGNFKRIGGNTDSDTIPMILDINSICNPDTTHKSTLSDFQQSPDSKPS